MMRGYNMYESLQIRVYSKKKSVQLFENLCPFCRSPGLMGREKKSTRLYKSCWTFMAR